MGGEGLISRYKHHIFVCLNKREPGDPRGCCAASGSEDLFDLLKEQVSGRGLKGTVRVNRAGCLDACSFGPSVVIYPQAVWYTIRSKEDVNEILDRHIIKGEVITRLQIPFKGLIQSNAVQ